MNKEQLEQLESLIILFENQITFEVFDKINLTVFSGNDRIKHYNLIEFYEYCKKHSHFKEVSESQLELVLDYLSKYHINIINVRTPDKIYHTEVFYSQLSVEKEKEILEILSIYQNRISNK